MVLGIEPVNPLFFTITSSSVQGERNDEIDSDNKAKILSEWSFSSLNYLHK
jgi:hypothetical protein